MGRTEEVSCGKSSRSNLADRLVGSANEGTARICGINTKVLIDTGSMVTLISESFYHSLDPRPELLSITDFKLDIVGASGSKIPYVGYIEGDIFIADILEDSVFIPILVVPDTEYRQSVPGVIGTNVLRRCNSSDDSSKADPFRLALDALKCVNLISVKSTSKTPIIIQPNQVATVSGFVRKKEGVSTAITEPTDKPQLSGLNVCPRVVSLENTGSTARIPVRVCNMTAKVIKIEPNSVFCSLSEVKVVDSWKPEVSTPNPESCVNKSFQTLQDLGIKVNRESLTEEQFLRVQQVIGKWEHIFSKSSVDIGRTDLIKHHIKLNDDQPFKQAYRRIPPSMYEEVRQHLREMVDCGAIRESKSPYCSNIVLVRKKNNSLRFCIDLRQLNKRTRKDAYTLPRVDDMLDSLVDSKYYTKLDLRSGYWQVEVAEDDKEKTAFTVGPLGHWECNRMPFGLTNAPSTFQRLMETCMGELNLRECLIFLDDVLIFSKTFDEHVTRLEAVFQRLEQHGLKLNPSKCEFFSTRVAYLGYEISAEGIHTDPAKIEPLKSWPAPHNIKSLRVFLGFSGYYRRFVENYAKIVKPLNELLVGHPTNKASKKSKKTKTPWIWNDAQQTAFETIIDKLTKPPVLAYADFSKPFIVNTDASTEGLGAVIYQEHDGLERVISYASRGLRASERNYPAHKLEYLCLKWAITDKFHDYLYGNTFTVRTDNNPLTYISTSAKLDATGHRWLAALGNYNFQIIYRCGKSNADADGLSRRPRDSEDVSVMFSDVVKALFTAVLVKPEEHAMAESLVISGDSQLELNPEPLIDTVDLSAVDWNQEQQKDPDIARIYNIINRNTKLDKDEIRQESKTVQTCLRQRTCLSIQEKVLYRTTEIDGQEVNQLVLPVHYRELALSGMHDDVGHQGRDRTLWLIKQRFYWPHMEQDVVEKVRTCPNCIRRKTPTKAAAHMVPIQSTYPMEIVCIDYLSVERSSGGYENILVITDHFTRYAQAIPTRNQTAHTTARVLFENFFCHYSFPARLHSDQGRNFESRVIKELCNIAGVEKSRTTPYHAMGNGRTERFNSTLLGMLGTLDSSGKANWKEYVKPLVHAYNATRHESTGFSPHYLLFGWHPRLAIDAFLGIEDPKTQRQSRANYVDKLKKRMEFAYKTATNSSMKEALRHKTYYDAKIRHSTLEVGDRVLLKNVTPKGKLDDRWEKEPYIIIGRPNLDIPVYKLKKESGKGPEKMLHRNLLLPLMSIPYEEIPSDRPIKSRENQPPHKSIRRPTQVETNTTEDSNSDSSTDSEPRSPRYVAPHRRPVPTPRVRKRPEQPTNSSHVVCEGQPNLRTSLENTWIHPSYLNFNSTRPSSSNSTDFHISDRSQSAISNREIPRNNTSTTNFSNTVNNVSDVSGTPVVAPRVPRPQRQRKPPDRYGEWVAPVIATTTMNSFPEQEVDEFYRYW